MDNKTLTPELEDYIRESCIDASKSDIVDDLIHLIARHPDEISKWAKEKAELDAELEALDKEKDQ